MDKTKKIAIVGGGIAGASVALYLAQTGLNITLFDKEKSLVSGPPMCHLHAGGNLYREIDDNQCKMLLKQSIELLRFYPYAIDFRPTVIATPTVDESSPDELLPRLKMLQYEYEKMIEEDPNNKVLGESAEYFKCYSKEDVLALREQESVKNPHTLDEWMIPVVNNIELDKIKYPLIIVQEYGLNVFRISASATLGLQKFDNVSVKNETKVIDINKYDNGFTIAYKHDNQEFSEDFDYLINAAGFRSGEIDDMLGIKRDRLVEFKAAYVTKCEKYDTLWPEVIFHGKRGTPQGMAQFTPYPDGYFQLHGMTKDITLFDDGLVRSNALSAQPKLDDKFIKKIDQGWCFTVTQSRTQAAIEHMAQYIPAFKDAKVASKPLYGAQQIPGEDADLRASEVSFEGERYARCEIVKASSILTMADAIVQKLIGLGFVDSSFYGQRDFSTAEQIKKEEIDIYAEKTCQEREYPSSLAFVNKSY
ncbi:FAD-dependent oxidoreductase [Sulfurimonas sp. C5]|uniref:FAD-dependent oxidoreductase n=1 Tax=Sulfurimonas sp. C5 TaxID=3036947 RepID=UPI002457DFEA|nr:FAD-dependent oxidoreductase [Sulfurimonas sp. C5]MDH4943839.1 FAD-dependent oxidoreductase [Sulfurimonas sp. C5]